MQRGGRVKEGKAPPEVVRGMNLSGDWDWVVGGFWVRLEELPSPLSQCAAIEPVTIATTMLRGFLKRGWWGR